MAPHRRQRLCSHRSEILQEVLLCLYESFHPQGIEEEKVSTCVHFLMKNLWCIGKTFKYVI
jgi:hypothetical protein